MMSTTITRRDVLSCAQAGLATVAFTEPREARAQQVPWSAGEERPRLQAPPNATDAHHHIYDSRFPVDPKAVLRPGHATVADYRLLQNLLHRGKAWVKLSGAYMETKVGRPTYADSTTVAQAYIREAPERLVWGTDWPHPTEKIKPDDAVLFDLLAVWAPDEATRTRILVDNPARLYGFS